MRNAFAPVSHITCPKQSGQSRPNKIGVALLTNAYNNIFSGVQQLFCRGANNAKKAKIGRIDAKCSLVKKHQHPQLTPIAPFVKLNSKEIDGKCYTYANQKVTTIAFCPTAPTATTI